MSLNQMVAEATCVNSENINATISEKINPRIRISNISTNLGKDELTTDIINRNMLEPNGISVVHTYKQKNEYFGALAEVTCDTYAEIMKTKSIYIYNLSAARYMTTSI